MQKSLLPTYQLFKSLEKGVWVVAFILLFMLGFSQVALAGSCALKSSFNFIDFVTSSDYSYCEACGYGYVTVEINNPYAAETDPADPTGSPIPGAVMSDIVLEIDLGSSGLSYASGVVDAVTFSVNGGATSIGSAPTLSGSDNRILTFTASQVSALSSLAANESSLAVNTITIRVAVANNDPSVAEDLWTASKSIVSSISFSDDSSCTDSPASSGSFELPFFEPVLEIVKTGWNYDSGQRESSASNPVFATNNDDVVWRIEITNSGLAPAQDVRIDDLMSGSSLVHSYICATAASANQIANNHGGSADGCSAIGNNLQDFGISDPFGDHSSAAYDGAEIDVPAGESISLYVVGQVASAAACTGFQTNSVNDVQWGCQSESPVGGITTASTDSIEPEAQAEIYTRYNDGDYGQLTVQRSLTGVNTSQPVGARGMMTITFRNRTGGSVRNIHFDDVLPPEYVVDTTYVPTVGVSSPYGTYPGRVSTINWNNPDYGDLLANTHPDFDLTSGTSVHPDDPDQQHMLRHGDTAVVRFRVVLIDSTYYDRAADLDVNPEEYSVTATDPTYKATLDNTLNVTFDTFCASQGTQSFTLTGNGSGNPTGSTISARPEDLDVAVGGAVFILSNDPTHTVNLPIVLTNNGGHDASDYYLYVTFGPTIEVVTPPSECSEISLTGSPLQPNPRKLWTDPLEIESTAIVYECTSSDVIAPGSSSEFIFVTRKSTDAARIALDDLTLRADVIGEITLADGTSLSVPAPITRADGETDPYNNYSLDTTWARVLGFNLIKEQIGTCNENNPPVYDDDGNEEVQIGEECDFNIMAGGWFGFETPGFTYISVQNVNVIDEMPDGQAYLQSTDPYVASTSLIQGVTLYPTDLTPPDERQFNWIFNVPDTQRIEVPDEWFEVDVKNRVLNKTVDSRSAPNYHAQASTNVLNATFDARFLNDNTGLVESYTLDDNTVGFPPEAIRRADLTVTEPLITLVKEVCNESLYGTGPSCTRFVTVTDEGDAYSDYIYRITVTNEETRNGVQRAPAYDVVVNDTLDASDYGYVIPFASDGLDNDGDGVNDGGDGDGEGTISNNVVKDGTPAVVTFSYENSEDLKKIEAGSSVTLYYRVDYDDEAAPLQTFVNTVVAGYDSLTGTSGSQTAPQGENSELAGARLYESDSAAASVQIVPVETLPKEVTALAVTPLAASGSTQNIKIGEEVEYQITALLPVAQFRDLTIIDELPDGMRCVEAPEIDLSSAAFASAGFVPGGTFTPDCADGSVQWNLGDQRITNRSDERFPFTVSFIAQVLNSSGNNDGGILVNGSPSTVATVSYVDEAGTAVSYDVAHADVTVTEPHLALTADFTSTDHDAGDHVTVSVTITNDGTAPAYNIRVMDDLAATRFGYVGNIAGSDPPNSVDITTFGNDQPVFVWDDAAGLAAGSSFSFTFDVAIDADVEPDDLLDNELAAVWTSLPGQTSALNTTGLIGEDGLSSGLRNGALPHLGDSINDYETTVSCSLSVAAPSVAKTDNSADLVPTIGVHKQFSLVLSLREGVTQDVRITDLLNAAGLSYVYENSSTYLTTYSFQDIVSINGSAPADSAFISVPAAESADSAIWNIGTVVTEVENDTATGTVNPEIQIDIYARINNDLDTDAGDFLRNGMELAYQNGETDADSTISVETASIGVSEPRLHVSKTVINVTDGKATDAVAVAGDTLEYTLTIVNVGSEGTTAYDINIVDTLPAGLELSSSITTTATIDGSSVATFVATPAGAPAGPLVWGRENADDSLDLATGSTLIVTYRTDVLWVSDPDGNIDNSVMADWTSLDSEDGFERTGAGCPDIVAPNDYCTGPVTASTLGIAPEVIFQMAVANLTTGVSPAIEAAPGDTLQYTMTIQNTSSAQADFYIQNVIDQLNTSGARFTPGTLVVNLPSATGVDYSDPEGGSDETGIVYVDELSVAPGETLTFNFTAQLASVIPDGSVVRSQSELYIFGFGAVLSDDPALSGDTDPTQITITSSPEWLFTKTSEDLTNSENVLMPGDQIHYVISVQNIGNEDATGVTLTDTLPANTTYVAGSTSLNGVFLSDAADGSSVLETGLLVHAPVPGDTTPGVMLVEDDTNTATVTFDVIVDAAASGGTVISNQAFLSGSGSGSGSFSGVGSDDPDTATDNDPTEDVVSDLDFVLAVYNTTAAGSGSVATPGDELLYTMTMTNTTTVAMNNLTISVDLDSLHSGDAQYFEPGSLTIVSVPSAADTSATDPSGGGKGSGLLQASFDLEAGDTATIEFSVRLVDVITSGTVVLNQGTLQADGYTIKTSDSADSTLTGDADATRTVVSSAPDFLIEKVDSFIDEDPGILLPGERIRYTLTVKNIGTEDAENVLLLDYIPANTSYVAGSTTLNGAAVADNGDDCPLITGLLLSAASSTGSGSMLADASDSEENVATVTFDVLVDEAAMIGLIIENQATVTADGSGSGTITPQLSDDPDTAAEDDPTRSIIGDLPLLYAHKTVALRDDAGTVDIVDPGDTLTYTITISNSGAKDATDVVLTDVVPDATTYVSGLFTVDGSSVADSGYLPLIDGLTLTSAGSTVTGVISAGSSVTLTFVVQVDADAAEGTLITNQGTLESTDISDLLTDADGDSSNGYQETVIVVGATQNLGITKTVALVDSGTAAPGSELSYTIEVTNSGSIAATDISVVDDLSALIGSTLSYVVDSATLNGSSTGLTFSGNILTAAYSDIYGDLAVGDSFTINFNVIILASVPLGTTITNDATVYWNTPASEANASVAIDVGGTPGTATLNGQVWHDADFDEVLDDDESLHQDWTIEVYLSDELVKTVTTDEDGTYQVSGLLPTASAGGLYEIHFVAPGAGSRTATLGTAASAFTNGRQSITLISASSGSNLQDLNMPLTPNGVIYNSIARTPVRGASVNLVNADTGVVVGSDCFADSTQYNQLTTENGYYKFDMVFGTGCPSGRNYLVSVTPPSSGFIDGESVVIPAQTNGDTGAFDVTTCPGNASQDAVLSTSEHCEVLVDPEAPSFSAAATSSETNYHLNLILGGTLDPGHRQIFNNQIPLDPLLSDAVAISKVASVKNVYRGGLVPYTITVTNVYGVPLEDLRIVDTFPAGFKYVSGSAQIDGAGAEPERAGRVLTWDDIDLAVDDSVVLRLLLIVGSGVGEGEYVNRARVENTTLDTIVSGEATATVKVIPDPDFDCSDVIGKVFDDRNLNGYQDQGEHGLAGVRIATAQGLIITTDSDGRYHLACAAVPDQDRGSNFIMKLDDRSLPTGYRVVSENPRVQRLTRGKTTKFNFAATLHRVVQIDLSDDAFEPETTEVRIQWKDRVSELINILAEAPSVLRIAYLADVDAESLVEQRLTDFRKLVEEGWKNAPSSYRLMIETEVFWRKGSPP